jgi:hypothetical protein
MEVDVEVIWTRDGFTRSTRHQDERATFHAESSKRTMRVTGNAAGFTQKTVGTKLFSEVFDHQL